MIGGSNTMSLKYLKMDLFTLVLSSRHPVAADT